MRDFISSVFVKTRKKSTVARKIYAVRSYYAYLVNIGALKKNPFDGIHSPKIDRRIPQVFTIGEMIRFLDMLPETRFLDLRNKTIFEFLYATGLRISELTQLKTGDIQFEERLVRVLGKGKKERIVPFNDEAGQVLGKYLKERDRLYPEAREREHAFINSRGGKISDRSVERILQRVYLGLMQSGTARVSPPVPPFLRFPPAAARSQPARDPGTAGSRQPGDDGKIHDAELLRSAENL